MSEKVIVTKYAKTRGKRYGTLLEKTEDGRAVICLDGDSSRTDNLIIACPGEWDFLNFDFASYLN